MKPQIVRRWAVVAGGLAVLYGLPVIASALPVSVPRLTAGQLRGRILASAGESFAGYAESNATFGLPPLSGLTGLTSLLDGVTKMRVWQATPTRWRVGVLSDAGERDTYELSGCRSYIWDSGDQLLTEVPGQNLVPDAVSAGGAALDIAGGTGVVIGAPLINAVIVRPPGFFVTFLLAGTVGAQLLEQAAATLTQQVTLP